MSERRRRKIADKKVKTLRVGVKQPVSDPVPMIITRLQSRYLPSYVPPRLVFKPQ